MPSSNQTTDIHIMLGEMRGQLREVVHTMNNTSQKIDALSREVNEVKGIAVTVAAIEIRLKGVEDDVENLKGERNRRDGAFGFFQWFINNWLQLISLVIVIGVVLKVAGKI